MQHPIAAIMIFQVAALLARACLQSRLFESGAPRPFAGDLSYLVVPPILIVLMYPILKQHWKYLLSLFRRQDLTVRLIALSVLLGFTLRMTYWGGLISLISFGVLRNSDPDAVVGPVISFGCPEPQLLALSFLVVVFLTPVIEEIINRGLILQCLMHRGKTLAVLLSAVLFAVIHAPQAMLLAFLVGLIFAVQTINYRTLWASLMTHATYNAVSVLDWKCMNTQWNPIDMTPSIIGVGLIATTVTAAGTFLAIVLVGRSGHRSS